MKILSHSLLLVLTLVTSSIVSANPAARAVRSASTIEWQMDVVDYEAVVLTIAAPNGKVHRRQFGSRDAVSFALKEQQPILDGRYNYQLLVVPGVPGQVKVQLEAARRRGDEAAMQAIRKAAGIPAPLLQNGAFTVADGEILAPPQTEQSRPRVPNAGGWRWRPQTDDEVVADDLIVDGRACVGSTCADDWTFGTEHLTVAAPNVRMKFDDTSVGGSGNASSDWQITVNDFTGSSVERFSIEDLSAETTPFTISAGSGGAHMNAIFIDPFGRVGLGTSTPETTLQVSSGFGSVITLEQNASFGSPVYAWALRATDEVFEILDTGAETSTRPFTIGAGAPTDSMHIDENGHVGLGTDAPTRALHAIDVNAADNTVLEIQNNGPTRLRIRNGLTGETWNVGHQSPSGTGLVYSDAGDAVSEMLLDTSGNVTIAGTLTQGSSRAIKRDFNRVDPTLVLDRVRRLPIETWIYKEDASAARHVGPMAEEFHATFGFGVDDKHIAPADQAGVALAAIQGLASEKDQQIAHLESRIRELEALIHEVRCPSPNN